MVSPTPLSPLLLFNLLATKTSLYRSTPKPSIRYTIVSSRTSLHPALFNRKRAFLWLRPEFGCQCLLTVLFSVLL
ncbi:uncharacterized protein K441DRAFT_180430 [Cenococcum geophilum 1.58]|uniref:uncharacterized protein n=1 Tax=Cenococcum geophilum 1.58 TaxID=794803 RepID=UPI00358E46C2|nr:hypothetical protein K441DRAFT_180430 [Cenococcum geophilum 1.58]